MDNIVVYTALFTDDVNYVFGGLPEYDIQGVDFICFTNTPHLTSDTWDIRVVDCELGGRKTARKYKMLPQNYLPDYDGWIWIDNSCIFLYNPIDLYNLYTTGFDLSVHEHCDRISIYQEAQVIIERGLDDKGVVNTQMRQYELDGYVDMGLFETGILMRVNNDRVIRFNNMWWEELRNNSIRDQLSFPYTIWKHGDININAITQTFLTHHHLLGKLQSNHFSSVPRQMLKLN